MTFGPPELAQLIQEAKATIAVAMLSSVGAGIVFGSIIATRKIIRAKRQRMRLDPPSALRPPALSRAMGLHLHDPR